MQILFVIQNPDVFNSPGSDTYILFGEASSCMHLTLGPRPLLPQQQQQQHQKQQQQQQQQQQTDERHIRNNC